MSENRPFHAMLISASADHRKLSRQQFQKLNLSDGQPKVLSKLLYHEGCLQKDLAKLCHVEPATMTSLLKNMCEKGYVVKKKEIVSGGKSGFSIHLTEQGRTIAQQVEAIVADMEKISFSGFSASEKEQFLSLFARITDNLSSD
jgi:DNA-binding MarR family transcriptional regulator